MKKLILSGVLAMIGLSVHAQFYNYSSSSGWGNTISFISPSVGSCLNPLSSSATTGSIAISSGVVQYNDVRGAHENRISTYLGNFYDQQFIMDFDFSATSTTSGKAIYLAALTSLNLNPQMAMPIVSCGIPNNMDEIGVQMYTTDPGSPSGLSVRVSVYDNGSNISPANIISLSYATTYYARLRIYGNAKGEFFIYSNSSRTALIGSFCFALPKTVNGLKFLQHATLTGAGPSRKTTATVDNTNVYKTDEPCCALKLSGPINYFETRYVAGDFELTGEGGVTEREVNLDEYGDVVYNFSPESGALTVNDWGNTDEAVAANELKLVTIKGLAKCRCETILTTKDIYIGPFSTKSASAPFPENEPVTQASDRKLHVYPNPAADAITVESAEEIREIVLLSADGVVLEKRSLKEAQKSVSVNLSARASGIYTVKAVTASGTLTEQVVKK